MNWIGAHMRVINRYQKRRESLRYLVLNFQPAIRRIDRPMVRSRALILGQIKLPIPVKKKENHKDTANKIEDQNGAADLKGSNI